MNKILIKRKSELSLELSNEMKKKKKDRNQKQIDSLKTCISNISKWLKQ